MSDIRTQKSEENISLTTNYEAHEGHEEEKRTNWVFIVFLRGLRVLL